MNTGTAEEILHQGSLPPKQKATCSNHVGRTTNPSKYSAKPEIPKYATRRAFANSTANAQITRSKDGQVLSVQLPSGDWMKFSPQDEFVVRAAMWRARRNCGITYACNDRHGSFHRFILNPPAGMVVDHIDGDGLNNTRENLRICTNTENIRNQRRRGAGKSGAKGVAFYPGQQKPFRAQITVNRKKLNLGSFATAKEAQEAYAAAAKELHGEFARPVTVLVTCHQSGVA